jgi:NMD protein affecting ribosome stability and mRNA decay
MSKNSSLEQRTIESVKCVKCGKKDATREDQMCDTCRFLVALDGIVESRK